jgi:hypothetical protein
VLMPQGSAYDVEIQGEELSATADEVNSIIAEIEQREPRRIPDFVVLDVVRSTA